MCLFDILLNEYNAKKWEKYASCFEESDLHVDGMPQDIVNAVSTVLGEKAGITWLDTPLHAFNGKKANELILTEEGEKALKAYIMRLPN